MSHLHLCHNICHKAVRYSHRVHHKYRRNRMSTPFRLQPARHEKMNRHIYFILEHVNVFAFSWRGQERTYVEREECEMDVSTWFCFDGPVAISIVIVIIVSKFSVWIKMFHSRCSGQMATAGSWMRCTEALPLHASVRFKYHKHFIGRGRYRMRHFRSTEAAQREAVRWVAIVNCQIVVGTFLMRFNFERVEMQTYAMTRCRCKMPHAILFPRIVIGIVRTGYDAVWRRDFVFAAALFAIESIVVQDVSIVAWAHIWTNRVPTFVHTAAIIYRTFVNVCDEDSGETTLLNRIVRTEFNAHFIALRCNQGWHFLAAKDTVPAQLLVVHFRVNRQWIVITFLLMKMIAFQIEMREIQCDAVLLWRNNLPCAILWNGINLREWRRCNSSIQCINDATTSIWKMKAISAYSSSILFLIPSLYLLSHVFLSECNS